MSAIYHTLGGGLEPIFAWNYRGLVAQRDIQAEVLEPDVDDPGGVTGSLVLFLFCAVAAYLSTKGWAGVLRARPPSLLL